VLISSSLCGSILSLWSKTSNNGTRAT
jgi:hypothetical protein